MTEKLPLFLDFGNLLLPPLKKFPLFLQKRVQAWIFFYALVVEEPGGTA